MIFIGKIKEVFFAKYNFLVSIYKDWIPKFNFFELKNKNNDGRLD